MKISFTTFACPDWTLDQVLEAGVRYGYHGVEFRCDGDQRHGIEVWAAEDERRIIRSKIQSYNLEPCCLASSLQLLAEHVMLDVAPRMDLAAELGFPGVRVFCGPPSVRWSKQDAIDRAAEVLHEMSEAADAAGVEVWLETHDTLSHAADCVTVIRQSRARNVGILYNTLHPFRVGESLDATMAALAGLVKHVHFHDGLNRPDQVIVRPLGEGELPMDDIFTALFNMGYRDHLCGEWFHEQYGDHADMSLERYHDEVVTLAHAHGMTLGA